jgi:carbamoyltransferase
VRVGPRWPRLGRTVERLTVPLYTTVHRLNHSHTLQSRYAQERLTSLREKIARRERIFLAGISPVCHNTGVSLVEIDPRGRITLHANDEEERYASVKHCRDYPVSTIEVLRRRVRDLGITPPDIHAWLGTWNYPAMTPFAWNLLVQELPWSLPLLRPSAVPEGAFWTHDFCLCTTPRRLRKLLGLAQPQPVISLRHHDNHAALGYALSPFNDGAAPVVVAVLDGFGDDGAITTYLVRDHQLQPLHSNHSIADSLGGFYAIISSTQGGWTPLSSEGRYMGAVAWGDGNRQTNPFYRGLRQLLHFAPHGRVMVNRAAVNWHNAGELHPYGRFMKQLLGEPIPRRRMWNPDAVLRVEDVEHSAITRRRVDIAAACQLVFEDAVFHIVDHLIRTTGSDRVVMSGGTALNCLVNMKLLEHFDDDWYRRTLGKRARLHLWVPPVPGDAGVPAGAAINFALLAGATPGEPLRHAFYCGHSATTQEIDQALATESEISREHLGNIGSSDGFHAVTEFMARVVSCDGVLGLYQGVAETGPRALGHRSILANPCNPRTLENINRRVKLREPIRPLAPMLTLEAARIFFELSPGASDDDYNAYNYMVLTVMAKPIARQKIPAVVHRDGTARIQIVRETDRVTYGYLKAMGQLLGAEVSVNTSLNVASPIVQTPIQALQAMKRAKGMTGMIMISASGDVRLAWHRRNPHPRTQVRWAEGMRDEAMRQITSNEARLIC